MLKILYFLILNIANLAKCTYGLSPLEQQYNFYFRKNTDSHVYKNLRELPQFYMFPCSHGNISFLGNEKEAGKSKESCLHKGRFLYLCVPLRFPKQPQAHALECPSLRRTHLYGNLPYNIIFALDTWRPCLHGQAPTFCKGILFLL
jgi:hypothetical protein